MRRHLVECPAASPRMLMSVLARATTSRPTTGAGGLPRVYRLRQPATRTANQRVRLGQIQPPLRRIPDAEPLGDLADREEPLSHRRHPAWT